MTQRKPKPPEVAADLFGGEGESEKLLGGDLSPAGAETVEGVGSEPGAAEGGAGAERGPGAAVRVEGETMAGDGSPYDDYRVWLHDPTKREPTAAALEVLGFPAAMLTKLPVPWVLHCAPRSLLHESCARFVVTNSRASYTEAREAGVPVFAGGEWYALAHAAQNDRVWPRQLAEILRRKTESGVWRLTHVGAFGGLGAPALIAHAVELTWTVGEVFRRMGATIERVEVRG